MPDVSIVNTTVTPAPTDYTVPGTQELLVKAVRASIDGSGAASSYLPALQLLNPAGQVMWTAVNPSDVVAAGASVDVSWFPAVGGNAASSGSSIGATTTIFHQELTAPAATLGTAANVIPATFAHFQVIAKLRTTAAVINDVAAITMNGDTGANYDRASVTWTGAAISFSSTYATTGMVLDTLGANADAHRFATIQAVFVDYADTVAFKNAQAVGAEIGAPVDADVRLSLTTDWTWKSLSAINQITLTPQTVGAQFDTGSSLTIYGIPPITGT